MKTGFEYPESSSYGWYAVHCRPRYESQVSVALRGKGYEEFLPTYGGGHSEPDRRKKRDLPLFPGYLFCHFDVRERLPILKCRGVISVVGVGKTPVPISHEEFEAVRSIVRSGLPLEPWRHVIVGSKVRIEAGPLTGLVGIALRIDKKFRLVVSVQLLQRSVSVEIERSWIRPFANESFVSGDPVSLNTDQRYFAKAGAG